MSALENAEAEAELLGALLVFYTPDLLAKVVVELQDDDFALPRHLITWRAICAVAHQGDHVDLTTVAAFLQGHRNSAGASFLDLAGGKGMLAVLESYAVAHGAVERARIIHADGEWRRRLRSCLDGAEACRARDEKRWREAMGDGPRLRVVEGGRRAS
jgi:replicative DNA helicase